MKIVVAVTAASGAIYAQQLLDRLVANDEVERVALIYSSNARAVVEHEAFVARQVDLLCQRHGVVVGTRSAGAGEQSTAREQCGK